MMTPWGHAQSICDYGNGIIFVTTAGHGGFHVPESLRSALPPNEALAEGWYEEDSAWSIVALTFSELFTTDELASAQRTILNDFPELAEHFGLTATIANSWTLREQAFFEAHREDYIVSAAWGEWKEGVPKGYVTVVAVRGGRRLDGRNVTSDEKWFNIPADEYAPTNFLIDPERHLERAPLAI